MKIDFFYCHIPNLNYIGYVKRNRLPTNCLQLPICINCYSLIFGRPTAETWHYRIIVLFRAMVCLVAGLRDIYTISMGNLTIIIVEFIWGSLYCIYLYIWYCFIFKTMHRKTIKKSIINCVILYFFSFLAFVFSLFIWFYIIYTSLFNSKRNYSLKKKKHWVIFQCNNNSINVFFSTKYFLLIQLLYYYNFPCVFLYSYILT